MNIPSGAVQQHYAHSVAGHPQEEWHKLHEHLLETAHLAESFASKFAPGWGRIAGLWHDAGKYQRAFQSRIGADPSEHVNGTVDHSSVGALLAQGKASPLMFAIAGHHGGLSNVDSLGYRLREKAGLLAQARRDGLPSTLEEQTIPAFPDWLTEKVQISLWTRFIFSALVDADFLDTERFYQGGIERDLGLRPSLADLKVRLDEYIDQKTSRAEHTVMNQMRARVLDACRRSAGFATGAFTLTVPTGGGKTLASLAFALDHAIKCRLQRVIVVIPYTSIIEQTAAVYRQALGENAVIEHHTNVDPDKETRENRLASENWDAPVVVTTSVQFFESLFANRTARCRKLHRIAGSVVVFDEVQTFPVKLLAPVRYALKELTEHYGATAVLCTATQPVLFEGTREIIPEPRREFAVVADRCEVLMPSSDEPITWEVLSAQVRAHIQVMAIVHRRGDAQRLAEMVGGSCLHLSARMCAAHRTAVLNEVKRRLTAGEECRLVATQLVEAGVDVDFPEVYRAFAGADSMAQAAGRCNREGRRRGRLHLFFAPTKPPRGILQTAEQVAKTMWREGRLDLTVPETFSEYFSRLYGKAEHDPKAVMAAEKDLKFEDVAQLFRMIEENSEPVVAPYGDWETRVEAVRRNGISRARMRRLQPFMVGLYCEEIKALNAARALERIQDTFWAVIPGYRVYDNRWGFGWKGLIAAEPEDFIA